jgi:hypothetical protein
MSKDQAINKLIFVVGILFLLLITIQSRASTIHHELDVEIQPGLQLIKAKDTISFTGAGKKFTFLLHKDLQISLESADDKLILLRAGDQNQPFSEYGLTLGASDSKASLSFAGIIFDPIINNDSRGLITKDGATLFGSTYWYPYFLDRFVNFEVTVTTPAAWTSLVQGQITSIKINNTLKTMSFVEIYPQEEIYLIAGPFNTYTTDTRDGKRIQVLLRNDDISLAQNFLKVIPDYIEHYATNIGAYPYATFSVVENLWETGYGMPSFTLLGPSVIRLPFILNSSLPHEILHNWWGNSVYVDYDKGNWCEGLTTYLADHWQQEIAGTARDYRLKSLMNYDDFVTANPKNDFPVRKFKGRHNSSSQAIGYGKVMMLFHMLEHQFGKDLFRKSLQDFFNENIYRRASYADLQKSFEKVTRQNLTTFFDQWVDREGAPKLLLGDINLMKWHDGSFNTTFALSQTSQEPYDLVIPILWTLESGAEVRQVARLTEKDQFFSFASQEKPVKVSIDPDFNLFRHLYREERPVTLSTVLGSPTVHFYLDVGAAEAELFAKKWAATIQGTSHINKVDSTLSLAKQGSLVLIGNNPTFAEFMKLQLEDQAFEAHADSITVNGQIFNFADHSTVIVARLKSNPSQSVVWVRWSSNLDAVDWAGRLTHYGSFGVLAFKGRPVSLKTTWPTTQSPLQRNL